MVLVREHMDLPSVLWTKHYLTYTKQVVGFPAPKKDLAKLRELADWLHEERKALSAYIALTSPRLFTQKATAVQADDIYLIPYPAAKTLDLSENERFLLDEIVDYQRDLIRLGEDSLVMSEGAGEACASFSKVFVEQINAVCRGMQLRAYEPYRWSGVVCQPYAFDDVKIDWSGAAELQDKLTTLLLSQRSTTLRVNRICRIYDGAFIFLIKPDRLRYWLRSSALRDADETLADLRNRES